MIVNQLSIQGFLDAVAKELTSQFRTSPRHTVVVSKLDNKYKTQSKLVVARIDPEALLTEEYADITSDILLHELNREEENEIFHGNNPMIIYIEGEDENHSPDITAYTSKIGSNAIIGYIPLTERVVLRYSRLANRKPYETHKDLKAKLNKLEDSYYPPIPDPITRIARHQKD